MNQLKKSNFDKFPTIKIDGHTCTKGWKKVSGKVLEACDKHPNEKIVIAVECYPGVYTHEIADELRRYIPAAILFDASAGMQTSDEIEKLVYPFVTDDPVFGYMSPLNLADFLIQRKLLTISCV